MAGGRPLAIAPFQTLVTVGARFNVRNPKRPRRPAENLVDASLTATLAIASLTVFVDVLVKARQSIASISPQGLATAQRASLGDVSLMRSHDFRVRKDAFQPTRSPA